MKNILFLLSVFLLPIGLLAQQQSSKSKSSDKLYEKGGIKTQVTMENAVGANTTEFEFSPTFYQNGIVFVSYHKNGPIDPKTGKPFFELFFSEMDATGLPQKPREFSLQINSQVHEGPVSFSKDGDLIYFTRNNLEGGIPKSNAYHQVSMKIYEARRGRYDWGNIASLPFNSDEYSCVHPTLSGDGFRLFFSSNMPGGYGGYDLYYTEKKADNWSKPVNLGGAVNTSGNELFSFVHESDLLFFSSNGHGGTGKLDIFMVNAGGSEFETPKNLGAPYNSPEDDLGFILNEDATRGFLASDRLGGYGGDDIYMFEAGGEPLIEMEEINLSAMVVAYDERTNERIPNAGIRILQRSKDGFVEGEEFYDVQLMPSDNGELLMKLVRKNPNELAKPSIFTNLNGEAIFNMIQDRSYVVMVSKEGYESGEVMHSTDGQFGAQTIRVPLRSNNCANLDGLVSVNGYRNGVPNATVRIVNETTGAEQQLRSNANGQFNFCLPMGYDYAIFASKEGYESGRSTLSTSTNPSDLEVTVRLQPMNEEIVKEPIKEGSVIVLENIYYDFDQYFIRKGAARELDALAQLMNRYPSMEVQLIAHTDARGDDRYNERLSRKRADSARRYLIQKGIAGYRVEAFGYGEENIRNHCENGVDCTDEQHQYNRRTEVKVIRIDEPVDVEYQEGDPFDKGRG